MNTDKILDNLFEQIDDLLCEGKFQECDEFIDRFPIELASAEELLVVLTATLAAKPKLKNRVKFFDSVQNKFETTHTDFVIDLLKGLK